MKRLIIILAFFTAYYSWGQNPYDEIIKAPEKSETTQSITRAWKDNAQITYIENIEYNPYNANEIISSNASFVYYNPSDNVYKVAEFSNLNWPRVTDFEIMDDTLYFCGYANIAASSSSPCYIGFVGYFCIPQLFAGTDVIHAFTFNPQTDGPGVPFWYVNEPCKLEVFKVPTGIHLVCTGGWSHSRDSLYSGGYFVADVVHQFSTGDWWYYNHRGDGIEQFTDVAVTDNYVVTIAAETNQKYFYLRVYPKPQSVDLRLGDGLSDPSIFDTLHRYPPYQSYCFTWEDGLFQDGGDSNYLKMSHPLLTHTNGDTIALAYLTYSWRDQHIFGTTVKVLDIADMLHVPSPNPNSGGVPFDPTGGSGGGITPDPEIPITPGGPPEPDPGLIPTPSSPDTVKFHYNRIIDLQDHALSNLPIDMSAQWTIPSMIYDSVSRSILVLQRQSYAPGFMDNRFAIDAFLIHQPTAPVNRYQLTSPTSPLHSLSGGLSPAHFCISGNQNTTDPELMFGSVKTTLTNCVTEGESIPTHYHRGHIEDIIKRINWNPVFKRERVPPTSGAGWFAAFGSTMLPVTIKICEKETICNP